MKRRSVTALAIPLAVLAAGTPAAARAADPAGSTMPVTVAAAEAAPASRDDLFGLGERKGADDKAAGDKGLAATDATRVSGFYDFELAYSYNGPGHWSRAVNRLQLNLAGNLGEDVKWKLGARGDIDPVYMVSDFYLPAVNRNMRASAFWGENYIDFNAAGWDFRLGAQQIVWGEVVGLFFADVVSARDQREFLLPSFDIIRIPQWAARAEYFHGDSHLELIWIPVPAFDRIGKFGSDYYPVVPQGKPTQQQASLFLDPDRPDRNLSNSNYGVRANTLVGGWDLAAFYYRSFNSQPTFYFVNQAPAQPAYVYQPRYDRIWQAGGTFSKDLGDFVLRGEAVYSSGQNYSLADPFATPEGVTSRRSLDAILSADFSPSADTRLNFQVFNRTLFGGGESELALKAAGWGGSVLGSVKFGPYETQVLWIQSFADAGALIRPRVAWTGWKNTTVALGVDVFTGPKDGYFGRYGDRDRIYTELRYDF